MEGGMEGRNVGRGGRNGGWEAGGKRVVGMEGGGRNGGAKEGGRGEYIRLILSPSPCTIYFDINS